MPMRSDDDTWDIASGVGRTALGVATFRAIESERPDAVIADPFARWFVEAADDSDFVALLADPTPLEAVPFFGSGFMGVRTKFFDNYFTAASADGVRQVVVVASGLDDRAYRLDWPAGTVVFELDRSTVLDFKREVLDAHDARPTADLRTVAVDLRTDWPAALARAGFAPDRPTAWSAEGLLPYLPGAAHDALFARIDSLSAVGSRLALNGFGTGTDIERFTALRRKYVGDTTPFGSVDLDDLIYVDLRIDPADWLGEHSWEVTRASTAALAEAYRVTVPPLPDDLAELYRTNSYLTATKTG